MECSNWYEELESKGICLTSEQKNKVSRKINEILSYEPKVGVFGKTGVGKSSLCNAIFGQDVCQISDVEACTRDTQEIFLKVGTKGLKLLDVPGVGENRDRDQEYAQLYKKLLPELDLVLWVIKADDRAMTSDEKFFKEIVKPHIEQGKPFIMVVNQVDKIEPFREWDIEGHEPGKEQFRNIDRKVTVLADQFGLVPSKVIAVSANEKYNLTTLIDEIIFALPKDKKITMFKAVDEGLRSEQAYNNAKQGFFDTIGDFIQDVAFKIGDTLSNVVGGVVDAVSDAWSSICDFLGF